MDDGLLTIKDAAARVGLSETAIRSAIDRGRLPAKTVLGRLVVAQDDLDAYRETTRRGRPAKGEFVAMVEEGGIRSYRTSMPDRFGFDMASALCTRHYLARPGIPPTAELVWKPQQNGELIADPDPSIRYILVPA
jgi:excisionase family DNA binding protein